MVNNFSELFLSSFKCKVLKLKHNKRLKRDCQRVAFPVPLSRGGFGGCVWVWLLCVVSPLGGR
ncbi:hypothetical protein FXE69_09620 [Vibrio cholerae]|nr:hypothetical protein [Vibrio cholerae]NAO21208.1 hypothetical protein [Vibrio cholerae]NAO59106.1 hypothetical protein [Vibrio cholerae]TXY67855.1 hypothetical protein FXE81_09720 [Vibrio cholerae]TXZ31951.1 hypothetical protein FXE69_09620 [Vibrio cholerae]